MFFRSTSRVLHYSHGAWSFDRIRPARLQVLVGIAPRSLQVKSIGLTRKAASIQRTNGRTAVQAGIIAASTNTLKVECMKSLWMAALLLFGSITASEAGVVAKEIDY